MSGSAPVIAQIAVAAGGGAKPDIVYALDANGAVWRLVIDDKTSQGNWKMLPTLASARAVT